MADIYLYAVKMVAKMKSQFHAAPPKQAGLAGFKNRVFYDDFDSTSTIDMANSQTGNFNWYLSQWFYHGQAALNPADLSVSNSVLTIAANNTTLYSLVSAFDTDPQVPDQFHGNVFGGGGYFEARMKYNPAQGGGVYFFLNSIEQVADWAVWNNTEASGMAHWEGQPAHYGHWIEVDVIETLGNANNAYFCRVHDWSGLKGALTNIMNDNYLIAADLSDPNLFHTYGVLWVPQNGDTPGRLEFYFDNVKKQVVYYKGPPGSPPLPGQDGSLWTPDQPDKAGRTYSIIDQHRLALNLHGTAACPLHVDWVKVWK
jgi:hypothetical protein